MYEDLGILDLEDDKVIDSIDMTKIKEFITRKKNSKAINVVYMNRKQFKKIKINVLIGGQYRAFFGIKKEGEIGCHEFTSFFYEDFGSDKIKISLAGKAENTVRNYINPIIRFLNYICNEGLKSIEDLDKDLIKGFLNLYAGNMLPDDVKDDEARAKTEVNRVNAAVTKFVYWLFTAKKSSRSKELKYKMKYFEKDDFIITQYSKRIKSGGLMYSYKLENLVNVNIEDSSNGKSRKKVTKASLYTVKKLVEASRTIDPMITFAIVLDAFAGLRLGEAMQMHNDRMKLIDSRFKSCSLYIDLSSDARLRSDGVKTGEIKINREQPVFEIFADIIRDEYKQHEKLLEDRGLSMHLYGALFINDSGKAMTSDNYMRRFRKVAEQAILNIKIEAAKGNELAIREERLLEQKMITPHSLRYIYSQFLKDSIGERAAVAYYRGDNSLDSQDTYIKGRDLMKAKELFFKNYITT